MTSKSRNFKFLLYKQRQFITTNKSFYICFINCNFFDKFFLEFFADSGSFLIEFNSLIDSTNTVFLKFVSLESLVKFLNDWLLLSINAGKHYVDPSFLREDYFNFALSLNFGGHLAKIIIGELVFSYPQVVNFGLHNLNKTTLLNQIITNVNYKLLDILDDFNFF